MSCTTTTRFSAGQSNVLYVGLRQIILSHITLKNTGHSPGSHPDLLTLKFLGRRGAFNKEQMEAIYRLWKTVLDHRGQEFRMPLGYIEVSACGLAVRTTVRQLRHQHVRAWTDGIDIAANHLLRRLEAVQKKLKRKIIKTEGEQFFRELAVGWREHLKWLRLNVLNCPCLVRRPNLTYRFGQLLINQMVRVTRSELRLRGIDIPTEPLFRKLVRDALKNVRRLRTPWTIPLLSRNPHVAAFWFANYVERRMASTRRS
jgi:hypothetical protein